MDNIPSLKDGVGDAVAQDQLMKLKLLAAQAQQDCAAAAKQAHILNAGQLPGFSQALGRHDQFQLGLAPQYQVEPAQPGGIPSGAASVPVQLHAQQNHLDAHAHQLLQLQQPASLAPNPVSGWPSFQQQSDQLSVLHLLQMQQQQPVAFTQLQPQLPTAARPAVLQLQQQQQHNDQQLLHLLQEQYPASVVPAAPTVLTGGLQQQQHQAVQSSSSTLPVLPLLQHSAAVQHHQITTAPTAVAHATVQAQQQQLLQPHQYVSGLIQQPAAATPSVAAGQLQPGSWMQLLQQSSGPVHAVDAPAAASAGGAAAPSVSDAQGSWLQLLQSHAPVRVPAAVTAAAPAAGAGVLQHQQQQQQAGLPQAAAAISNVAAVAPLAAEYAATGQQQQQQGLLQLLQSHTQAAPAVPAAAAGGPSQAAAPAAAGIAAVASLQQGTSLQQQQLHSQAATINSSAATAAGQQQQQQLQAGGVLQMLQTATPAASTPLVLREQQQQQQQQQKLLKQLLQDQPVTSMPATTQQQQLAVGGSLAAASAAAGSVLAAAQLQRQQQAEPTTDAAADTQQQLCGDMAPPNPEQQQQEEQSAAAEMDVDTQQGLTGQPAATSAAAAAAAAAAESAGAAGDAVAEDSAAAAADGATSAAADHGGGSGRGGGSSKYGAKRAAALKRQGYSNAVPGPNGSGKSHFRGVFWDRKNSRWRAQVGHNNRKIFMGYFAEPAEAARAYDKKVVQLHGALAKTNFPLEDYTEDLRAFNQQLQEAHMNNPGPLLPARPRRVKRRTDADSESDEDYSDGYHMTAVGSGGGMRMCQPGVMTNLPGLTGMSHVPGGEMMTNHPGVDHMGGHMLLGSAHAAAAAVMDLAPAAAAAGLKATDVTGVDPAAAAVILPSDSAAAAVSVDPATAAAIAPMTAAATDVTAQPEGLGGDIAAAAVPAVAPASSEQQQQQQQQVEAEVTAVGQKRKRSAEAHDDDADTMEDQQQQQQLHASTPGMQQPQEVQDGPLLRLGSQQKPPSRQNSQNSSQKQQQQQQQQQHSGGARWDEQQQQWEGQQAGQYGRQYTGSWHDDGGDVGGGTVATGGRSARGKSSTSSLPWIPAPPPLTWQDHMKALEASLTSGQRNSTEHITATDQLPDTVRTGDDSSMTDNVGPMADVAAAAAVRGTRGAASEQGHIAQAAVHSQPGYYQQQLHQLPRRQHRLSTAHSAAAAAGVRASRAHTATAQEAHVAGASLMQADSLQALLAVAAAAEADADQAKVCDMGAATADLAPENRSLQQQQTLDNDVAAGAAALTDLLHAAGAQVDQAVTTVGDLAAAATAASIGQAAAAEAAAESAVPQQQKQEQGLTTQDQAPSACIDAATAPKQGVTPVQGHDAASTAQILAAIAARATALAQQQQPTTAAAAASAEGRSAILGLGETAAVYGLPAQVLDVIEPWMLDPTAMEIDSAAADPPQQRLQQSAACAVGIAEVLAFANQTDLVPEIRQLYLLVLFHLVHEKQQQLQQKQRATLHSQQTEHAAASAPSDAQQQQQHVQDAAIAGMNGGASAAVVKQVANSAAAGMAAAATPSYAAASAEQLPAAGLEPVTTRPQAPEAAAAAGPSTTAAGQCAIVRPTSCTDSSKLCGVASKSALQYMCGQQHDQQQHVHNVTVGPAAAASEPSLQQQPVPCFTAAGVEQQLLPSAVVLPGQQQQMMFAAAVDVPVTAAAAVDAAHAAPVAHNMSRWGSGASIVDAAVDQ